ncbi:class I SAM-dependent methyltransferase [Sandaracinobacteroides saxicola]|uniref:Class I SAM-dependent methyltransferase n=1 Tax=Sandaracinobacteroides saxicola TaxID=2759707 RepID=A0A7G5IKL7_9SPHN|nr:class I SAM-dependent methyltransferase [Sandaracinobacteroides saxicola]QMW23909.1 class I SAM-dependent methyltransferase [Sandaracinobacteroides saxicola]
MTHICKICGSTRLSFAFAETDPASGHRHESWQCANCGCQQTVGDIPQVSPDYVRLTADNLDAQHRYTQFEAKQNAFEQWRALLAERQVRGGNLLDIGCGVGSFLDVAREQGFETFGFDASAAHADAARTRHDKVRNATSFRDYEMLLGHPVPPLDAITMWDVFEHIRDPSALLAEVREALAPGGLFFVSVPARGLNRLKVRLASLRGRTPGLVPWEHVYYHTPQSLGMIFERNGLRVLDIAGVVPYCRPPSPAEHARRIIQGLISQSPFAVQIYALAQRA